MTVNNEIKGMVYVGMFTALLCVGAYIKIMLPIGPFLVTFSLQFLFAVMAGLFLGERDGFLSVLAYIFLGLVGLPVFAHGGGIGYVLKPTFGFLIGFAAAAFVSGFIIQWQKKTSFIGFLFAAFCGEVVYYICGLVYYSLMVNLILTGVDGIGISELIRVWCLSTVVPDFCLCIMAALIAERVVRAMPELRSV